MATGSNTSLLYYFTPTYFANLVINAFNKQMGTTHNPINFIIEQIPNDQNSRCAYEFYSKDVNNLLRIRIYCELATQFSLSPFYLQDVIGDYNSENATLNTGYYSLPVVVSFNDAITQDASLIKSIWKADFKIGEAAYKQYSLSTPNQCPPYGEYGNEVWILGSQIDNEMITDNNGNCLVLYTD
jgi:hypothetical protein